MKSLHSVVNFRPVQLASLAQLSGTKAHKEINLPVYSVTKHRGFVLSLEYFNKQVFSRELSGYKIVEPNELAYATIHLDEGSIGICPERCLISPMYTAFRVDTDHVLPSYLFRYLKSPQALAEYPRLGKGSVERRRAISFERLGKIVIPLPPIAEQKQIVEILDRAEELRSKRRQAIALLDTLTQAIFLEMFGDPATNPKGWAVSSLGELASKFSDGPFGSNLKTSHYTEVGIRVIRLQNIGIGEFLDKDKAYISREHFAKLNKHECHPGDVLIGTLGDPNLRACIQPDWLALALNKADCVQLRANQEISHPVYICALLNQPAVERMAQEFIVGQTRLRISMGRLRMLKVPLPPLLLQQEFARRVEAIEKLKIAHRASLSELDALFASLQHRAFRGEL